MDNQELKDFICSIIEEEFSPKPVAIGERWAGGSLIMKPNNDTQSKEVPLEIFFKKLTSIRESLRVMEQKINNHSGLTTEDKATFQSYITKAYGSLTTFNILFKDGKDKFIGSSGSGDDDKGGKEKLSAADAKRQLGLKEYGRE